MTEEKPRRDEIFPVPRELLRWIYLGRLTLVLAILAGALSVWRSAASEVTVVAIGMFVVAVGTTAVSFWWTELAGHRPGTNFRYLQVVLDAVLVTATVHITGGSASDFSPLYILVISEAALILPLAGGVLMGILASVLFSAEILWLQGGALDTELILQLALFAGVAVATGLLGDRLRRAGVRLGAVESELRQLRLDTTEILDSLSTGILTVDGRGRLAYLNHAGARLLGIDPVGKVGQPVADVLSEPAPAMGRLLRRSIEDRVPILRFKTSMEREGKAMVLGVSTTIMDRNDADAPSATAIFQDITNQERADILDRRNQRLEAVAELSASLAHEIKNPLASIRSSVEQLTGDDLEPRDRKTLSRLILAESDRLSRLLSEFLEFSGLKKGESSRVELSDVVRDAAALARQHPDAPEGVTVSCEGLDAGLNIPGDADLLHRAVYNLVLNALQFSGEGGRVAVTLQDFRTQPPGGIQVPRPVALSVRDSGPGIPDDELDRIFDPFYTTRPQGNGLGLAVVHRAVEAHRGAVFASNAPDGGAEFKIYLPGVEEPNE